MVVEMLLPRPKVDGLRAGMPSNASDDLARWAAPRFNQALCLLGEPSREHLLGEVP